MGEFSCARITSARQFFGKLEGYYRDLWTFYAEYRALNLRRASAMAREGKVGRASRGREPSTRAGESRFTVALTFRVSAKIRLFRDVPGRRSKCSIIIQ